MDNDEYKSDSDEEEDPQDPATMMKNLGITTGDVFEDDTNSNAARNASANIVSQQILFYVACCLRGHFNKLVPAAPVILVYGGGYIGQRVIDALTKAKCAEMLHVYTRGDLKAKYWRTKGLKSRSLACVHSGTLRNFDGESAALSSQRERQLGPV